ncbi:MAG: hypothetical protein ABSF72_03240 [Candidatus Sulfotelmatobacter sp.]
MATFLFCSTCAVLSSFFFLLVRINARPCPSPPALVSSQTITLQRYDLLRYKAVIR